jgi:hypothetical protein
MRPPARQNQPLQHSDGSSSGHCAGPRRHIRGGLRVRRRRRRHSAGRHLVNCCRKIRERPRKQRADRTHADNRRRVPVSIKSVYIEVDSDRPERFCPIVPIIIIWRQGGRLDGTSIGGIRAIEVSAGPGTGSRARDAGRSSGGDVGGITRVFVPGSLLLDIMGGYRRPSPP